MRSRRLWAPPPETKSNAAIVEAKKIQSPPTAPNPAKPDANIEAPVRLAWPRPSPFDERINRAIGEGIKFVKTQQRPDGSWPDANNQFQLAATSLTTLALLTAGESPGSETIRKALAFIRNGTMRPTTYAVALQTLALAAAEPDRDLPQIGRNVNYLEAQLIEAKPEDKLKSYYALFARGRRMKSERA